MRDLYARICEADARAKARLAEPRLDLVARALLAAAALAPVVGRWLP